MLSADSLLYYPRNLWFYIHLEERLKIQEPAAALILG